MMSVAPVPHRPSEVRNSLRLRGLGIYTYREMIVFMRADCHICRALDAYAALQAAGPARIVSCNTVAHPTNEIDVDDLIVANVGHIMGRPPSSTPA